MDKWADLHLHTNHSDGSDAPGRVVERAAALGMSALAITDHDSVSAVHEAQATARQAGLEYLPGVELSTLYGQIEIHILGLGVHPQASTLLDTLSELHAARSKRVDTILERLNALSVPLTREEVEAQASGGEATSLGRMHVAMALHAKGITRTVQQGFDRFIRRGRKAYIPKKTLSCRQAIDLIHEAGGLAFLAHPGVGTTLGKLILRLIGELPFDGIEVYHSKHTSGQAAQFLQIAQEHSLLVSGGSDCHGTATHPTPDMGRVRLPYRYYEAIRERVSGK